MFSSPPQSNSNLSELRLQAIGIDTSGARALAIGLSKGARGLRRYMLILGSYTKSSITFSHFLFCNTMFTVISNNF